MVFIDACLNKKTPYTPIWLMRQAGRYLPEYRAVRAKAGNFLSMCRNSDFATEVTLQPIDILDVDAAILFSDILVTPLEMGMDLRFVENEGPLFDNPIKSIDDLAKLKEGGYKNLTYVYDAISKIREKLNEQKALIGFCGSPWTLATYMVEGKGSKTYSKIKKEIYSNPEFIHLLLRMITEDLKGYLETQINSGVNAVMVFDSWASALDEESYFEFSWSYMKELSSYIKSKFPNIPVMLFPKGIAGYLDRIDGDFDVFGVDWGTPMQLAKDKLGAKYILQGNLEPTRLYSKNSMEDEVRKIIDIMQNRRHIFNLGHGMVPDLPVENAKYLVKLVRELSSKC